MRKLLLALAMLAIPAVSLAQINQWTTPPLYEKPVRWGGWTIAAHDTCSLLTAGAEDTTEAIRTFDWSWSGTASSLTTAAAVVGELCIISTNATVGGNAGSADTIYYSIEQSPDGQTWSTIPHKAGLAQITSGWPYASGLDDGGYIKITCLPVFASVNAAWTASGGQWASPFIRFRIQLGTANGSVISGGRAYIRYFRREGM